MVTDQQVRRLFKLMQTESSKLHRRCQSRHGREDRPQVLKAGKLPNELMQEHTWRTRADPLKPWGEVCGKSGRNPGLEAKTLFEDLQKRFPGKFSDGQLRTLQRRVKRWRALEGPSREVILPPTAPSRRTRPVRLHAHGEARNHHRRPAIRSPDLSFRTDLLQLGNRQHLLLRKLRKPQRRVTGCALGAGRRATDPPDGPVDGGGTQRLACRGIHPALPGPAEALRLAGRKTQAASPNENGDVEQRNHRFKRAVQQTLLLRGSSDFANLDDYRQFLRKLFARLNSGRRERFLEEQRVLNRLPDRRLESCTRLGVTVSRQQHHPGQQQHLLGAKQADR